MPKSKRRKGGKKKARQYGKEIRSQRIGADIKKERLMNELQVKYQKQYEDQIREELERREKEKSETIKGLTDENKDIDTSFLGGSNELFQKVKKG